MHVTDLAMCTCIKCLHTFHTNSHVSCLLNSHCTILVTCTCIAFLMRHNISPSNCTLHILATLTCIKCSNMPHMLTFSYTKYTSHILATCTFNKFLHISLITLRTIFLTISQNSSQYSRQPNLFLGLCTLFYFSTVITSHRSLKIVRDTPNCFLTIKKVYKSAEQRKKNQFKRSQAQSL